MATQASSSSRDTAPKLTRPGALLVGTSSARRPRPCEMPSRRGSHLYPSTTSRTPRLTQFRRFATLCGTFSLRRITIEVPFWWHSRCIQPLKTLVGRSSYFAAENISFESLFFDIEGPEYWNRTCAVNVAFLHKMVGAARSLLGADRVGIYASESQWAPIMCGDEGFSDVPLWYAHWDGQPSFADYHQAGIGPFGGWSKPEMKQYHGSARTCGVNADLNYRPH